MDVRRAPLLSLVVLLASACQPSPPSGGGVIGPAGGTIELDGVTLTFPPNAVAAPVTITVTQTSMTVPGYDLYSPLYQFGPEGIRFGTPVVVTISYHGDSTRAELFWSREATAGYDALTATSVSGALSTAVTHFSTGFVGTPSAGMDGSTFDGGMVDAGRDMGTPFDAEAPGDATMDGGASHDAASDPDAWSWPDAWSPPPGARALAPLHGAHATSTRPTFHWVVGGTIDGAEIDICHDAFMTTGCTHASVTGTSYRPTAPLAQGQWFWRLTGTAGGVISGGASPVWRVAVPSTDHADGSWGCQLDVDGDGVAELATTDGDSSAVAQVHVFDMARGGPTGVDTVIVAPLTAGADFGRALSNACDVNADGYVDLLVGAPVSLRAYLYLGGPSGISTVPAQEMVGAVGSAFGTAVSGTGDVDGDGFGDVLVMGTSDTFLFRGSALGVDLASEIRLFASGGGANGVGDVNGDGLGDVVGGPGIWFGSATSTHAQASYPFSLGERLGDVDGDGLADFMVAAPNCSLGITGGVTSVSSHLSMLLSATRQDADFDGDGHSDIVSLNTVFYGDATVGSGPGVAPVRAWWDSTMYLASGDYDGDGFDDVAATGWHVTNPAFIYRGGPAGLAFGDVLYGLSKPNAPLFGVGDLDADGRGDIYVALSPYSGLAFGAPDGLEPISVVTPSAAGEAISAAAAGDVDGDGHGDLVVGWSSASPYVAADTAYVIRMIGRTVAGVTTLRGTSTSIPPSFGQRVTAAGDVNHDGYADVLVQDSASVAWVFPGSPTGTLTTPLGIRALLNTGVPADDIDGDAHDDVLVVSQFDNYVYAYHGGAAGLGAPTRVALPGWDAPEYPDGGVGGPRVWNGSVLSMADVDGDGRRDIVLIDGTTVGVAFLRGGVVSPYVSVAAPSGSALATGTPYVADRDGDGLADVVLLAASPGTTTPSGTGAYFFRGGPSGFAAPVLIALPATVRGLRDGGDVDGNRTHDAIELLEDWGEQVIDPWIPGTLRPRVTIPSPPPPFYFQFRPI